MKAEHKIFVLSVLAGLSVWVIDAVVDSYIFRFGPFLDLLIPDMPGHEWYIRTVILGVFVAFGLVVAVYARHLRTARERIAQLNRVLLAIRNVNQLITRRMDRDGLLQEVCRELVKTRGFHSAWIALTDESHRATATYQAGLGEAFEPLAERLGRGDQPEWCVEALARPGTLDVAEPVSAHTTPPPSRPSSRSSGLAVRLEHEADVFGLLA
ncbi:hypothetical protein LCGC14_2380960, partial [marine sediment metagenome]